ncbi:threonine/serine exporter family protein [Actinopolymorpha sp. NPDC004070]|uniref:threonine/serine ThrE exporter family protein n=1 Tax=Actinopolymorpha sp. NPDC004070 TaxID=3154548 RepID=UPI0033A5A73F
MHDPATAGMRNRLRRAAGAALRRDEPVVSQRPRHSPYPVRTATHVDDRDLRHALDFLLRLGELLLRSGAGSVDVEASIVASATALGLEDVEASVTYTQVLVSVAVEGSGAPLTDLRIVRVRAVDHNRLVALHQLVLGLTEGSLTPDAAYLRLNAVVRAPKRYPRWVVSGAWGGLAAAVAVQLGGGWLLGLVTFCTTVVIDRLGRRLARRNLPDFYLNFIGAALVTSVAVALTGMGAPVQPGLVVAGGVVLLLPGIALLGAVQDALTGFMVTASARAMEVVLLAAGITGGVAAALIVARQVGVAMTVAPPAPFTLAGLPPRFLSAGVVAAAMAVGLYASMRLLPAVFLLGGFGWVAYLALDEVLSSPSMARGLVAVVIGMCGQAIASRRRLPALAVVLPAIVPMLPGLTIYSAMLQITQGDSRGGISGLLLAATESLALAAGAILGEFLLQPLRRGLSRSERRYAGPRLVGPARVLVHRPRRDHRPHRDLRSRRGRRSGGAPRDRSEHRDSVGAVRSS